MYVVVFFRDVDRLRSLSEDHQKFCSEKGRGYFDSVVDHVNGCPRDKFRKFCIF